jgi:hypothetical protein
MTTPTSDPTTSGAARTAGSPTSSERAASATSADEGRLPALGDSLAGAAVSVKETAADAVSRLPEVAATTRSAIEDANRQINAGSDEMLVVGTLLAYGFALGLLVGGASRLLVAVALVPAAALGLNLLDRGTRARGRPASAGRMQGG